MDFYTVLDQVVALLRRRGRVSYRALKRQFALDDELLADLTAELRYAHCPIEEDHDQGLVWTGETAPRNTRCRCGQHWPSGALIWGYPCPASPGIKRWWGCASRIPRSGSPPAFPKPLHPWRVFPYPILRYVSRPRDPPQGAPLCRPRPCSGARRRVLRPGMRVAPCLPAACQRESRLATPARRPSS
jgi:hypothetical protein